MSKNVCMSVSVHVNQQLLSFHHSPRYSGYEKEASGSSSSRWSKRSQHKQEEEVNKACRKHLVAKWLWFCYWVEGWEFKSQDYKTTTVDRWARPLTFNCCFTLGLGSASSRIKVLPRAHPFYTRLNWTHRPSISKDDLHQDRLYCVLASRRSNEPPLAFQTAEPLDWGSSVSSPNTWIEPNTFSPVCISMRICWGWMKKASTKHCVFKF